MTVSYFSNFWRRAINFLAFTRLTIENPITTPLATEVAIFAIIPVATVLDPGIGKIIKTPAVIPEPIIIFQSTFLFLFFYFLAFPIDIFTFSMRISHFLLSV